MRIREYRPTDWERIADIHDRARKAELALAGLEEAFLPLEIAAEREALFEYPGLFVAEEAGTVVGFTACTEEELAWLYVDPDLFRRGIGRALTEFVLERYPSVCSIEALVGNEPARRLYESAGFSLTGIGHGWMPGNESFRVSVYILERSV